MKKYRCNRETVRRTRIRHAMAVQTPNHDPLYNTEQAAQYLACSSKTLARWRCEHPDRIEFIKVGKSVRYRESTLENYIRSRTVSNGAGVGGAAHG